MLPEDSIFVDFKPICYLEYTSFVFKGKKISGEALAKLLGLVDDSSETQAAEEPVRPATQS